MGPCVEFQGGINPDSPGNERPKKGWLLNNTIVIGRPSISQIDTVSDK